MDTIHQAGRIARPIAPIFVQTPATARGIAVGYDVWKGAPRSGPDSVNPFAHAGRALNTASFSSLLMFGASLTTRALRNRTSRRSRGGEEDRVVGSKQNRATFVVDNMSVLKHDGIHEAVQSVTLEDYDKIAEKPTAEDDIWLINLLYDGDCPSCMKQVEFLTKRMDENPEYAGLVRLTDLASSEYDAESCGGVSFADGMRHIHAVTKNGEIVTGMDVFRRVYSIVGMEWVYTLTTLPIVGSAFDWLYDVWAEHRLRLLGREDVLEKIHHHQHRIEELAEEECEVECEIDWDDVGALRN